MKERTIEVTSDLFTKLYEMLHPDEREVDGQLADSHGNNIVLYTAAGLGVKRLVVVRKRATGDSTVG